MGKMLSQLTEITSVDPNDILLISKLISGNYIDYKVTKSNLLSSGINTDKLTAQASFSALNSRCIAICTGSHQSFEFLTVKDKDNKLHKVLLKLRQNTGVNPIAANYPVKYPDESTGNTYYSSALQLFEISYYDKPSSGTNLEDRINQFEVNYYSQTSKLYSNTNEGGYILPHQGFFVKNKYIELNNSNQGNIVIYCGSHPCSSYAERREILKITLPITISNNRVIFSSRWSSDSTATGIVHRYCTTSNIPNYDGITDTTEIPANLYGAWNRHADLAINPEGTGVHMVLNDYSRINHFFIKSFSEFEACFNNSSFNNDKNIYTYVSNIQEIQNNKLTSGIQATALDDNNFYYLWSNSDATDHEIYLVNNYATNPTTFKYTLRLSSEGLECYISKFKDCIDYRIKGHHSDNNMIITNLSISRIEGESLFWIPETNNQSVYHLCMGVTTDVTYDYTLSDTTTGNDTITLSLIYDLMSNGNKLLIEN